MTADGLEIRAKQVVFCTGYELPKIVHQGSSRIVSTWAIATRAKADAIWPQQAPIWEASDPYLYLRATADGRVICGGEDEGFSNADARNSLLQAKTKQLEEKLHRMFPASSYTAVSAWTGSFGATPNGMPRNGAIPGLWHCYGVMGYGGNGITFSILGAKVIASALSGTAILEANLFAF